MPRDKSLSHEKVKQAIKEEFLEKGYEDASIRSIGARAGMTSAGLYRHYADKEAMFDAMVEPLIADMKAWTRRHTSKKHNMLDDGAPDNELFGETFIDMIREVILPQRDEFILLMTRSGGTKHENFIHDYVESNQKEFLEAIRYLREKGYPTLELSEEELHMLLSAYLTACFEPIIHYYDDEKVDKYLNTVQEFFMPGWLRIMGVK
ncbi:TetR/AcrR family transcriptional regulator [Butyrivibrio sp. YAB3001]|uniref:TetR/AcrR family transcriptional regulator n=1 Tax=Butyrivibrio sp. YAB3001 TaxID=1520812 RepID=UPI0008F67484|nr:TetR/AcrR family transcriptional regulator [Butyrivibrio sp. YAB3001]SFC37420.1 transcriptional regulator, TetR family [Butyrivibrio sp. YAB3001]